MKITITKWDDKTYPRQQSEVVVQQPEEFDPKKCIKIGDDVYDIKELQEAINTIQRIS